MSNQAVKTPAATTEPMTIADRVEFAVLIGSGLLLGILTSAFLMVRIGGFPFPITALIACLGNILLWRIAALYTKSPWQFAPLAAWTIVTILAMLPVFGNGSLIGDWRLLLLFAFGLAVPAFVASSARMKTLTQP